MIICCVVDKQLGDWIFLRRSIEKRGIVLYCLCSENKKYYTVVALLGDDIWVYCRVVFFS